MSTGGSYLLLANSIDQNNILNAGEILRCRLESIRKKNEKLLEEYKKKGQDISQLNVTKNATYGQMMKSHVFPLVSSYKPFVTMGNSYDVIRAPEGVLEWGSQWKFKFRNHGEFISDAVLEVKISSARTSDFRDKFKYCEFPGHRMMKRAYFRMNNSLIDQYDSETYNEHYAFRLPHHKREGWKRCMGQETDKRAYIVREPGVDEIREVTHVTNGLQTEKRTHPEFTMWIPLMFWFQDPKQAIPIVAMPDGTCEVTIETATLAEMIASTDYGGGGAMDSNQSPRIITASMHVNHIYVSEDIHDLLRERYHFMLMRVHQTQYKDINTSQGQINQLNELRYPIESLSFAAFPTSNLNVVDIWHRKTSLTQQTYTVPVIIQNPVANTLSSNVAIYHDKADMFDTMTIKVQGIELFVNQRMDFFTNYMPQKQNDTVTTPEDRGWAMLSFNTDANAYQPTGYLNLVASRELVFQYTSSTINTGAPARFVCIARALNFLIIDNGGVRLKYIS